jgi:hypothetical protein
VRADPSIRENAIPIMVQQMSASRIWPRSSTKTRPDHKRPVKESADAARKAADAADLSAHAALGMKLRIVRATRPADLLMLDKPVPVDKPYGGIVADHFPSQYSAVSAIYFRNDGRYSRISAAIAGRLSRSRKIASGAGL